MGKRSKATCTPEQWAAILAKGRVYSRRPDQVAKRSASARRRWAEVVKPQRAAASEGDPHYHRAKKHGLSSAACEALFQKQHGACAVCRKPLTYETAKLDHDHESGSVRGFLCTPCNTGEGWVKKWGAALAAYLSSPPAVDHNVLSSGRKRASSRMSHPARQHRA